MTKIKLVIILSFITILMMKIYSSAINCDELINKADISLAENKFEEAIAFYTQAIELGCKDYNIYRKLGRSYFRIKEKDITFALLSMINYDKSLELKPEQEDVKKALKEIIGFMKNEKKINIDLEKAVGVMYEKIKEYENLYDSLKTYESVLVARGEELKKLIEYTEKTKKEYEIKYESTKIYESVLVLKERELSNKETKIAEDSTNIERYRTELKNKDLELNNKIIANDKREKEINIKNYSLEKKYRDLDKEEKRIQEIAKLWDSTVWGRVKSVWLTIPVKSSVSLEYQNILRKLNNETTQKKINANYQAGFFKCEYGLFNVFYVYLKAGGVEMGLPDDYGKVSLAYGTGVKIDIVPLIFIGKGEKDFGIDIRREYLNFKNEKDLSILTREIKWKEYQTGLALTFYKDKVFSPYFGIYKLKIRSELDYIPINTFAQGLYYDLGGDESEEYFVGINIGEKEEENYFLNLEIRAFRDFSRIDSWRIEIGKYF